MAEAKVKATGDGLGLGPPAAAHGLQVTGLSLGPGHVGALACETAEPPILLAFDPARLVDVPSRATALESP